MVFGFLRAKPRQHALTLRLQWQASQRLSRVVIGKSTIDFGGLRVPKKILSYLLSIVPRHCESSCLYE